MIKRYRVKAFARSYQAGLEAVFALVVAVGIGFWVDTRYDTLPVFLLAGSAVGFGACILRLLRHQRELDRRSQSSGGETGDDSTD